MYFLPLGGFICHVFPWWLDAVLLACLITLITECIMGYGMAEVEEFGRGNSIY